MTTKQEMLVHTLNSWGGESGVGKGEGGHRQLKRELRLLSICIWQRAVTLVAVSSAWHVSAADMRMREQRAQTHSAASTPFQGFLQRRAYICRLQWEQFVIQYWLLRLSSQHVGSRVNSAYNFNMILYTRKQNPVPISYAYLSSCRHSRHLKSVRFSMHLVAHFQTTSGDIDRSKIYGGWFYGGCNTLYPSK